jgi:micrococcal nuclease
VSRSSTLLWLALFAALTIAGAIRLLGWPGGHGDESFSGAQASGRVVRVIDGDTVRVLVRGRARTVRYIGVDTPESVKPGTPVQCFAVRASEFNRRLVAGRKVVLHFGPERFDRYGRLLAYVFVDGGRVSVSARLVALGYGRVLAIPPNTAHERRFRALERSARAARRGLWGTCPA